MIHKYTWLVGFCGHLVSLLGTSEVSGQISAEVGGSYFSAALLNAQAIQNYDCLVVTESVHSLPKGQDAKDAGYYEEKVERIICDYPRKTIVYMEKQRFTAVDPNKVANFRVKLPFERASYLIYADGVTVPKKRSYASVGEFMQRNRIPAMEFACANGHPYHMVENSREEHVANQLKAFADVQTSEQPDGSVCCTLFGPNKSFSNHFFINPSSLLPKRFVTKEYIDGESVVALERRFKFEVKKEINLLVECDFEEAETPNVPPYHIVGTSVIRWLQLNEKELKIPNLPTEYSKTFMESLLQPPESK